MMIMTTVLDVQEPATLGFDNVKNGRVFLLQHEAWSCVILHHPNIWFSGGAPLLLEALWNLPSTPEIAWSLGSVQAFHVLLEINRVWFGKNMAKTCLKKMESTCIVCTFFSKVVWWCFFIVYKYIHTCLCMWKYILHAREKNVILKLWAFFSILNCPVCFVLGLIKGGLLQNQGNQTETWQPRWCLLCKIDATHPSIELKLLQTPGVCCTNSLETRWCVWVTCRIWINWSTMWESWKIF